MPLTIGPSNTKFVLWFATRDASKGPLHYEPCDFILFLSLQRDIERRPQNWRKGENILFLEFLYKITYISIGIKKS